MLKNTEIFTGNNNEKKNNCSGSMKNFKNVQHLKQFYFSLVNMSRNTFRYFYLQVGRNILRTCIGVL